MTDPEAIDRRLAAARSASWAPADAKARVRANLAASGVQGASTNANVALGGATGRAMGSRVPAGGLPGAPSATATRTGSVTRLTTSVLVGMGFVVGYWLGVHRAGDAPVGGAAATVVAAGEPAPSEPLRSLPPADDEATGRNEPVATNGASATMTAPSTPSVASPSAASPSAAESSHAPRSGPRPRAPRAATPVDGAVSPRPPTSNPDPFADELALLQRAERAIRSGEAPLAVSFLDELDRRFPHTTLSEERSAARVLAECALSSPDARPRAELFLRDRETSVYSDRVRRLCGLELSTPAARGADGSQSPGH
jgi:hypothetical protein